MDLKSDYIISYVFLFFFLLLCILKYIHTYVQCYPRRNRIAAKWQKRKKYIEPAFMQISFAKMSYAILLCVLCLPVAFYKNTAQRYLHDLEPFRVYLHTFHFLYKTFSLIYSLLLNCRLCNKGINSYRTVSFEMKIRIK